MSNDCQLAMFTDAEADIRHRSNAAHQSGKLTGVESFVLWTLEQENAYGMDKAVSIQTLQNIWNNTCTPNAPGDRSIKGAVKTLLEEYAIPIGSCRIPGRNGYYLCIHDSDAEDAVRPLKSEIFSLFRRIKALSPKSEFVRKLNGQLTMEMENVRADS